MIVTDGVGRKSTVVFPDVITRWTRSSSPAGPWVPGAMAACSTVDTGGERENVVRYVVVVEPFRPGTSTSQVMTSVGPFAGSLICERATFLICWRLCLGMLKVAAATAPTPSLNV